MTTPTHERLIPLVARISETLERASKEAKAGATYRGANPAALESARSSAADAIEQIDAVATSEAFEREETT